MSDASVKKRRGGKPTRDDVAKHAQISGATVSRVLSGRTDFPISKETRTRVLEAVEHLGYRPNPAARTLSAGRSGLIGFWMSLHYSHYRGQVLDRMRSHLAGTDWSMAVTDVDAQFTADHSLERALRVPVDGIVAFDNSSYGVAFNIEQGQLSRSIPFVSMGAYYCEDRSYVGIDLRHGTDLAMNHLFETGRRRISYMAPWNSGLLDSGDRYDTYAKRMKKSGLPIETIGIGATTVESILCTLSGMDRLPEAILCMHDDIAIAASAALQRLGVRPGCEVALVGFDGIDEVRDCDIPISTVEQPVEEMCALTCAFLKGQIESPSSPIQQQMLNPKLIVRDSSGR